MVSVARQILHFDLGVGDALLDQGDDIFGGHWHGFDLPRYSVAFI
jgi:hypothetical protein